MSSLQKFIFEGLPVRGVLVHITDAWQEILRRRAANTDTGAYPEAVQNLLGEMVAAGVLMQSNIKFNGALVLQISGNGPVKLAVVEVQPDCAVRATASVQQRVEQGATLSTMVNVDNLGRCAITLDPKEKFPGQQPYQGIVPLFDDHGQPLERLSAVLEHYMLQSEQLDTTLVLAADARVAAGLLIQRLPMAGENNLAGSMVSQANEDQIGKNEHYNRIALLAKSLKSEELLQLDAQTILHRLFWQEEVRYFEPMHHEAAVRFSCTCSRERVGRMIVGLGQTEAESILAERDLIEVGCEFCGTQYRFDAVDAAQLFLSS